MLSRLAQPVQTHILAKVCLLKKSDCQLDLRLSIFGGATRKTAGFSTESTVFLVLSIL
jgi:hypothetical protein